MEQRLLFVSKNIHRLFKNSKSLTFSEPELDTSDDIEAIITLNCIVKIAHAHQQLSNHDNIINFQTLKQIIDIKCREFCNTNLIYQPSTEQIAYFTNTFYSYLDNIVTL